MNAATHPVAPADVTPVLTLPWLRWLRWSAVAGQTLTVACVALWIRVAIPVVPVCICIAITALSNLALHAVPRGRCETPAALAAILVGDVVLLTALLHFTGGPHNPFSSFYLVQVALAAVVLPPAWAGSVGAAACAGYMLLFLGGQWLPRPGDDVCGIGPSLPLGLHLRGMLVAFVLTAASVAFFVNRLQQSLRRHEVALKRARERAAHGERFAALATLAAGAAHELGTPIGTIVIAAGEVARTARGLPAHPDLADDAELIREEARRCRAILDRLQDQSGDPVRPIAIDGLLSELAERFGPRLRVARGADADSVAAPPGALGQALVSLVQNAFDASPAGSTADLRAERVPGGIAFRVRDQGTGLSNDAARHAGEPFFTTKPAGQGMGLGLFLVRLLAQRLSGGFTIEPRPGGGTEAVLTIPNPAT